MATEDYVSFEVAKLLKEKGFNFQCEHYYDENGRLDGDFTTKPYPCPTHTQIQWWLREKKNVIFYIDFEPHHGWVFYLGNIIRDCEGRVVDVQHCVWSDDVEQPHYYFYEQAVEAALKSALESLI